MRRNTGQRAGGISTIVTIAALTTTSLAPSRSHAQNPPRQAPAPAEGAPAAPAPKKDMLILLKEWEVQSARLKTLDVNIRRIDTSPKWNDPEEFQGRAILKSPHFAWLHFDSVVKEDGKPNKLVPVEQIRCTGDEVWQYDFAAEHVAVFPLDKEKRKRALEEGPLPFLFNFKKDEALARYGMTLMKEDAERNSYLIGILPKEQIDQESFSKAFVELDKKYLLPTRIYLISPNGKDSRDYRLYNIKPNWKVEDVNFQPIVPMKVAVKPGEKPQPWKIIRNPAGDAGPVRPNNGPQVQPALRPGVRPPAR